MNAYRISQKLLGILYRVSFRLEIYGRSNIPDPPYLVASNHASYLDPAVVGLAIGKDELSFMAKKELMGSGAFGKWCRAVGCIEVKRGEASVRSLREAIKRLRKGKCVAIFPEGTRSEDGTLQDAKRGTGFIIANSDVPVVPIYLDGTLEAKPRGGRIRWGSTIRVFIGRPIEQREFSEASYGKRDYEAFTNLVMERIAGIKSGALRA